MAELKKTLDAAEKDFAKAREAGGSNAADLEAAQKNLKDLKVRLQAAQQELEQSRVSATGAKQSVAHLQELVTVARQRLTKAEAQLKELQAAEQPASDDQLVEAKARVTRAQEKLKVAQDDLDKARAAQPNKDQPRESVKD